MIIIFSPSKEMREGNIELNKNIENTINNNVFFLNKSNIILNKLSNMDKEDLQKTLKIKGKILDKTFENIKNYKTLPSYPSIYLYFGTAFKELDLDNYTFKDFIFMDKHIYILSAFYGILKTSDKIKPYRLDFNISNILDESLVSFWKKDINIYLENILKDNNLILNLASLEYSKLIDRNKFKVIDVFFYEIDEKGNKKAVSTFSKMARGSLLNYIIKNNISNIEDIKNFKEKNYFYNEKLSGKGKIIFTR